VEAAINNSLLVFLFIVSSIIGERAGVIVFAHLDVQFQDGGEGSYGIWTALKETKMLVPMLVPFALGAVFPCFGCKADKVVCCLDPALVCEVHLPTMFLLKDFGIKDLRGFSP
jgi:hypothetical protein